MIASTKGHRHPEGFKAVWVGFHQHRRRNHERNSIASCLTGISLALFGAIYLYDPFLVYSSYGLGIDGVSNAHVVRSASGGPLFVIGLVILGGAFIRSLEVVSLSLQVTYLGGVVLGRAVSMVVDPGI